MKREEIKKTEKLYSTLGELIYAVAKADGLIQDTEFAKLEELLEGHDWAETIRWSFEYEVKHDSDAEQVFQKVINKCEAHGPAPEFLEFIDLINQIAEASNGIDEQEERVITGFSHDLIARFRKKIKSMGVN